MKNVLSPEQIMGAVKRGQIYDVNNPGHRYVDDLTNFAGLGLLPQYNVDSEIEKGMAKWIKLVTDYVEDGGIQVFCRPLGRTLLGELKELKRLGYVKEDEFQVAKIHGIQKWTGRVLAGIEDGLVHDRWAPLMPTTYGEELDVLVEYGHVTQEEADNARDKGVMNSPGL